MKYMKRILKYNTILLGISLLIGILGPMFYTLGTRTTGLQDQRNPMTIIGAFLLLLAIGVYFLAFVVFVFKLIRRSLLR